MNVPSIKPARGWRVLLGEVGVIVLGVLIALAIGVIADMVRWRLRAGEMRVSILGEMALNAGVHEERSLVQPCLVRRLDEIDRLLRAGRQSGVLPDIGEIGRPPTRPLSVDSWELASGSEALLYFDPEEVKVLSLHYGTIANSENQILAEHSSWSELRAIEHAPGRISDDLLSEMTVIVGRLRFQNYINGIEAEQSLAFVKGKGVTPRYFTLFDRDEARSKVLELVTARPVCKPLMVDGKPQ